MKQKSKHQLDDLCNQCGHSYGAHAGFKIWPEGTPIPQAGSCTSCGCVISESKTKFINQKKHLSTFTNENKNPPMEVTNQSKNKTEWRNQPKS